MNNARKEIANKLCSFLTTELDGLLANQGFSRLGDSLQYSRPVDAGTQCLNIYFDLSPSSDPRAIALILPQIRFAFPQLNQRMLEVQPTMGDMPILGEGNDVTINEQIQNAAPRDVRSGTWWFIYDHDSVSECIGSIREFVKEWTIPFLDQYTTIISLTKGFEQQDERLPHDRRFWLFIVAAYTLLNKPEDAMQLLECKFGRPGARRDYAQAFEYVARLL